MALEKNKTDADKSQLDSFGVWVKNPPNAADSAAASSKTSAGETGFDDSASFDDVFEKIENESFTDLTSAGSAMGFAAGGTPAFDSASDETVNTAGASPPKAAVKTPAASRTALNTATENILRQISSELSTLKSEINSIKLDLESLKSHGAVSAPQAVQESFSSGQFSAEFDKKASGESFAEARESDEGFFSGGGDDETIALSGDELQKILINSEFQNQNIGEMPDIDFTENVLEESALDTVVFEEGEIGEDGLPDEIDIPKSDDDILAESSSFNDEAIFDEPVTVSDDEEALLSKLPGRSIIAHDTAGFREETVFEEQSAVEEEIDDTPTEKVFGEQWGDAAAEAIGETSSARFAPGAVPSVSVDNNLMEQVKTVLTYMDQLLENLPEKKIEEFAHSEHFESYKKLFDELGIS